VVEAIQELHSDPPGIAHLDIRLENVCFHSGHAVLIDFDRSAKIDEGTDDANMLSSRWGESLM
jgi:tRNA A-37 threonylcarbamoyl transferase component Bud32